MLHIFTLTLALASHGNSANKPSPHVGSRCVGSRDVYALGTGNIPGESGRGGSVVNIWVVRKASTGAPPVAWIFKNLSGEYFIQVNSFRYSREIERTFPASAARNLLSGATKSELPKPQRLSSIAQYDDYFEKMASSRTDCFSSDLPARYL